MLMGVMWLMTAMVVGFMAGRISMYGLWEAGDGEDAGGAASEAGGRRWWQKGRCQVDDRPFWSVGSPVTGTVLRLEEGDRPSVVIYPDSDRLYAPASGKVSRVFPMGNAFCLTTESGAELYLQAGNAEDDLMSYCYRPRVLRNEVVEKGKLLLEFDRGGLEAEGLSAEVSVCVERSFYGGEIRMTAGERVRVGEELLQIVEPGGQPVMTPG